MRRAVFALVLSGTLLAAWSLAAAEHVTVPAPLGQANKDSVVQTGATLRQASCGKVIQGEPARRQAGAPVDRYAPVSSSAPDLYGGMGTYAPPPSRASAPTGPALVEASYLTIRGTVTAYTKGRSVAILDRNGRARTIPLLEGAGVYEGLKVGDSVSLRVPVEESGSCNAADRVERQKAPVAALPSKFSMGGAAR